MNRLALDILNAGAGHTYLFFTGQSGFVIKSRSGTLLGIDLYLSDCVERVEKDNRFKRLVPKVLSPYDITFDHIIATHAHVDHFDIDAMPGLMSYEKTQLFASKNCESLVKELRMDWEKISERITYISVGNTVTADDFLLHFVSCDHGEQAPDAVGVVIEVDGLRIYVAGDTCLRLDRASEYTAFGPIDVMIAPINGAFGNMNEEECVRFADAVKPKVIIPCHFGMTAMHRGDPGRFLEIAEKQKLDVSVHVMGLGETLRLP